MNSKSTHIGRPKKHDEIVWFGMKLSPTDKEKIKHLASSRGIPASTLILALVENEILQEQRKTKLTAGSLRKLRKEARSAYLSEAARKASDAMKDNEYELIEDITDILEY